MIRSLALLFFAVSTASSQSDEKPEFEVASVKPSDDRDVEFGCRGGPGTNDPTLVACGNQSLGNLLIRAYGVDYFRISGPDWIWPTHFNIRARVPEGTTRTQLRQMWQNLLVDRFKLIVHRETRQGEVYDLVVTKGGPKFKAADSSPHTKPGDLPPSPLTLDKDGYPAFGPAHPGVAWTNGLARMYFPAVTLDFVVGELSVALAKQVNDETALRGEYEIGLRWAFDVIVDHSPDVGPRLDEALREQLGLRLVPKKGPLEFLVVDHCERVPSEN